mmetsp:Transcript_30185/g.44898  ORF Transcript_30185/g.44898 Transcript_30185/m.44898 type:complete len:489 (-) Transcript_30185:100-1566(-)
MTETNDEHRNNGTPPATTRISFAKHLSMTTKQFLQHYSSSSSPTPQKKRYNIIMGNEAGDADSIISSLAYSYVKSLDDNDDETLIQQPIVCIPKDDLPLRRETTLLLDLCGIPYRRSDDLLFINDESIETLLSHGHGDNEEKNHILQLTLMDHNRIKSSLNHLSSNVVEIVDHHQDEGYHQETMTTTTTSREIAFENGKATVGSTCTLVAERLFHSLEKKDEIVIDYSLGLALLGVILIDTMNMNPNAGKGTKRDEAMIHSLLKYTDWSNKDSKNDEKLQEKIFSSSSTKQGNGQVQPNCAALYELLQSSKFDRAFWEDEMNVRDCLRIDYKRFQVSPPSPTTTTTSLAFGMSSVLLPMDSLVYKKEGGMASFQKEAQDYMESVNVNLLLILSMTIVNDEAQREMIVIGKGDKIVEDVTKYLLESDDAAFLECAEKKNDIAVVGDDSDGSDKIPMKWFIQGNTKGSRKQVAPVIMRFVADSTIAAASL